VKLADMKVEIHVETMTNKIGISDDPRRLLKRVFDTSYRTRLHWKFIELPCWKILTMM